MRVRDTLGRKITTLMTSVEADSPVFLFIPSLRDASSASAKLGAVEAVAKPAPAPSSAPTDASIFADLLQSFRATKAKAEDPPDWEAPLRLLERLATMQPDDPYILQQLALATYKYEQPDKVASLVAAKRVLEKLAPRTSSDAETVGLWGAIHKRLAEKLNNRDDIDEALRAYGRGYYIKNDYYNGINYAFMLNVRAACSEGDDALADRVLARRTRLDVFSICDVLESARRSNPDPGVDSDDDFWIGATKVEALFGLGRKDEAAKLKTKVIESERERLKQKLGPGEKATKEADWKERSLNEQLDKLNKLLPP
jgi:tetratricopeptide (TPR) repeat protein